jgi:hypothetical protein
LLIYCWLNPIHQNFPRLLLHFNLTVFVAFSVIVNTLTQCYLSVFQFSSAKKIEHGNKAIPFYQKKPGIKLQIRLPEVLRAWREND